MKNLFCLSLIIILALFITTLNAQVQLGLQAGANFGDVSLDPTPEGFSTGMRTGIIFGGVLFLRFFTYSRFASRAGVCSEGIKD